MSGAERRGFEPDLRLGESSTEPIEYRIPDLPTMRGTRCQRLPTARPGRPCSMPEPRCAPPSWPATFLVHTSSAQTGAGQNPTRADQEGSRHGTHRDEQAIRAVIDDEIDALNKGDAASGRSRPFPCVPMRRHRDGAADEWWTSQQAADGVAGRAAPHPVASSTTSASTSPGTSPGRRATAISATRQAVPGRRGGPTRWSARTAVEPACSRTLSIGVPKRGDLRQLPPHVVWRARRSALRRQTCCGSTAHCPPARRRLS